MMLRLRQVAALVIVVACTAAPGEALTFVFVHDKSAGRESIASLTHTYSGRDMIDAVIRNGQAKALVVTYDGTDYYWDAAADVARQITRFLNRNRDEQLITPGFIGDIIGQYGWVVLQLPPDGLPSPPPDPPWARESR